MYTMHYVFPENELHIYFEMKSCYFHDPQMDFRGNFLMFEK